MLLLTGLFSLGAWTCLLLAHGRFAQSGPELPPPQPSPAKAVAIVIPARNEAEHIAQTLHALLAQQVAGTLNIVLVDDNSTDRTGILARAIAQHDKRLNVVDGTPLPAGWSGKMWAVSQGLQHPAVLGADYVLLTDADILHAPGHLASLLSFAENSNLGLVSEMVALRCETFAERSTLPAFVFFFQMLYPFAYVNDPGRRTAAAAGGTMLFQAATLRAIGGVDHVRSALIDDVALAKEAKKAGFGIWLGHGTQALSQRRYHHLGDVWEMIARTAYVQLRHSPVLLLGTVAGMLLLYAVPPALALGARRPATRAIGTAAWLCMAAAMQPTLRRFRQGPLWGLALPLIATFYMGATVSSGLRSHRGAGGRWKGRTYSPAPQAP